MMLGGGGVSGRLGGNGKAVGSSYEGLGLLSIVEGGEMQREFYAQ